MQGKFLSAHLMECDLSLRLVEAFDASMSGRPSIRPRMPAKQNTVPKIGGKIVARFGGDDFLILSKSNPGVVASVLFRHRSTFRVCDGAFGDRCRSVSGNG